jgi:hypothetical protein
MFFNVVLFQLQPSLKTKPKKHLFKTKTKTTNIADVVPGLKTLKLKIKTKSTTRNKTFENKNKMLALRCQGTKLN